MSYMALYRRWRPQTFDEVVEQSGVVNILKNAVKQNRIAHAYLFSGTRGTGKTTLAKIFARAVNCLHPVDGNPCNECEICRGILNRQILDVSEIDAASNNGVDNIRSIIDDTVYASSVARYRVYIVDEVHMLSAGAFNALLKTLEEPPENVIFILATTEPQKLPVTILSRCQRFDFKRISREGIARRLRLICDESGIDAGDEALNFLAEKADGALRDAISLLDQTLSGEHGHIGLKEVRAATGSLDREFLWDFAAALIRADGRRLIELTHRIFSEGRDPSVFIRELMSVLRNMLIINTVPDPGSLIYEDAEGINTLKRLGKGLKAGELSLLIQELSRLDNNLKWAVSRQIVFEAGVLTIADRKWHSDTASLETRLSELENRLADLMRDGVRARAEAGAEPLTEAVSTSPRMAEPLATSPRAAEPLTTNEVAANAEAEPAPTNEVIANASDLVTGAAEAVPEAAVNEAVAGSAAAETAGNEAIAGSAVAETAVNEAVAGSAAAETAENETVKGAQAAEAPVVPAETRVVPPAAELAPFAAKLVAEEEAIVPLTPENGVGAVDAGQTELPRKLSRDEWKRICSEIERRGQVSMLTWYEESVAQHELPRDRLLLVFEDDMTVSILRKSTPANLKVVTECIDALFGRHMEQVFALTGEADRILADNTHAPAPDRSTPATIPAQERSMPTSANPAAKPEIGPAGTPGAPVAPAAAPDTPAAAPAAPNDDFVAGVDYFKKLSGKLNFPIEFV